LDETDTRETLFCEFFPVTPIKQQLKLILVLNILGTMKRTTTHHISKLLLVPLALLSATMVRAWLPSRMAATAGSFRASTVTTSDSSVTTNTLLKLATDIADSAPPAVVITPFVKPERIVLDNTLYVYDHCPFCVRVRLALGIKNVKHNLHFLANDDVAIPTRLVGKKIAPIFVSIVIDDQIRWEIAHFSAAYEVNRRLTFCFFRSLPTTMFSLF
jgi:hypothetical protein